MQNIKKDNSNLFTPPYYESTSTLDQYQFGIYFFTGMESKLNNFMTIRLGAGMTLFHINNEVDQLTDNYPPFQSYESNVNPTLEYLTDWVFTTGITFHPASDFSIDILWTAGILNASYSNSDGYTLWYMSNQDSSNTKTLNFSLSLAMNYQL